MGQGGRPLRRDYEMIVSRNWPGSVAATAVSCLFGLVADSRAQGAASGSPSQTAAPEAQTYMDSALFRLMGSLFSEREGPSPWQRLGPVTLRPHISATFSYSDGLRSRPGQNSKTAMQEYAPGMLFQLGRRWTLDYTPSLTFYSNDEFEDTLDHFVTLSGGASYHPWNFGFSQSYSVSSAPLVETGQQTSRQSFGTSLSASRY